MRIEGGRWTIAICLFNVCEFNELYRIAPPSDETLLSCNVEVSKPQFDSLYLIILSIYISGEIQAGSGLNPVEERGRPQGLQEPPRINLVHSLHGVLVLVAARDPIQQNFLFCEICLVNSLIFHVILQGVRRSTVILTPPLSLAWVD